MNTQEFEKLLTEAIYNQRLAWDVECAMKHPDWEPPVRILYEFVDWDFWFAGHSPLTVNGAIITLVEEVGGEGEGDHKHLVFRVDRAGQTQWFKRTGHYTSYEGTDWDEGDLTEVTPRERTVIVYE